MHSTQIGRLVISCLLIIGGIAGCAAASTDVTSRASPAFSEHRYSRILVYAVYDDLAVRERAEARVCKRLRDAGVEAFAAIDLIFPGDDPASSPIAKACNDHQIEAVLLVGTTDEGSSSSYVPPTYHTDTTATGSATSFGTTTYGKAQGSSTTYTTGGYTISRPWAAFSVRLIDVQSGQTAWIATAKSRGNAYARQSDLLGSLGSSAVYQLKQDGLLAPTATVKTH